MEAIQKGTVSESDGSGSTTESQCPVKEGSGSTTKSQCLSHVPRETGRFLIDRSDGTNMFCGKTAAAGSVKGGKRRVLGTKEMMQPLSNLPTCHLFGAAVKERWKDGERTAK